MKRLSLREFALLCSPLVVVAVVGFLLSRRKPPSPNANKLHLEFHVENPTVLEAFQGVDAALVVELGGPDADKMTFYQTSPFLELQTAHGTQTSRMNNGGIWGDLWKNDINGTRLLICSKPLPPGKLRFGINASINPKTVSPFASARWPHLSGKWPVDRTKIESFNFGKLARTPLVVLRSMKIASVTKGEVTGECIFDLTGAGMNTQTPTEFSFSGGARVGMTNYGIGWGTGLSPNVSPETATRRVRHWSIFLTPPAGSKVIARVSGRVSANGRWPLAFQIEPFDFAKAKVGQNLKFKSWPLAAPISN